MVMNESQTTVNLPMSAAPHRVVDGIPDSSLESFKRFLDGSGPASSDSMLITLQQEPKDMPLQLSASTARRNPAASAEVTAEEQVKSKLMSLLDKPAQEMVKDLKFSLEHIIEEFKQQRDLIESQKQTILRLEKARPGSGHLKSQSGSSFYSASFSKERFFKEGTDPEYTAEFQAQRSKEQD